jgi:hypothetical protein
MKLLNNFEHGHLNLSQNSLHYKWSMFPCVNPSLAAVKMHQDILSLAAFGMILQDHRRHPVYIFGVKIGTLGSLKRVTERFTKICKKTSKKRTKTLIFIFYQPRHEAILKTISRYR